MLYPAPRSREVCSAEASQSHSACSTLLTLPQPQQATPYPKQPFQNNEFENLLPESLQKAQCFRDKISSSEKTNIYTAAKHSLIKLKWVREQVVLRKGNPQVTTFIVLLILPQHPKKNYIKRSATRRDR